MLEEKKRNSKYIDSVGRQPERFAEEIGIKPTYHIQGKARSAEQSIFN